MWQKIQSGTFQWICENYIQVQQVQSGLVAAASHLLWISASDSSVYFASIFCSKSIIIAQLIEYWCVLGREVRKCGKRESCKVLYSYVEAVIKPQYQPIVHKLANQRCLVCGNSGNVWYVVKTSVAIVTHLQGFSIATHPFWYSHTP